MHVHKFYGGERFVEYKEDGEPRVRLSALVCECGLVAAAPKDARKVKAWRERMEKGLNIP